MTAERLAELRHGAQGAVKELVEYIDELRAAISEEHQHVERDRIAAERAEVEKIIASLDEDDHLGRMSLGSRLEAMQERIDDHG